MVSLLVSSSSLRGCLPRRKCKFLWCQGTQLLGPWVSHPSWKDWQLWGWCWTSSRTRGCSECPPCWRDSSCFPLQSEVSSCQCKISQVSKKINETSAPYVSRVSVCFLQRFMRRSGKLTDIATHEADLDRKQFWLQFLIYFGIWI